MTLMNLLRRVFPPLFVSPRAIVAELRGGPHDGALVALPDDVLDFVAATHDAETGAYNVHVYWKAIPRRSKPVPFIHGGVIESKVVRMT